MNQKVTIILPLAITSLISGVYCPPKDESVFPSRYTLRSCRSDSSNPQLNEPGSNYEIARSERTTGEFCLIQKLPNNTRKYYFKPEDVEFLSMKGAVITMIIPNDNRNDKLTVTCVYPTYAVARMFYKNMTQGRNNLIHSRSARSFMNSDDSVLVELPTIYVDCSGDYIKIVITNIDESEVVYIFSANAISGMKESGPTGMSVYISFNSAEPELYKFAFYRHAEASNWIYILETFNEHTGAPHLLAEFAAKF